MNPKPFLQSWRSVVSVAALALASIALPATPTLAAGLNGVAWNASNTQTGAANITYAFSFKTATAGTIKTITMAVPNGVAGTPVIAKNYGITAGSVALSGCPGACLLTYTVTSAVAVAAGIPIYIEVSGMTNTPTAGTYSTSITTKTAAPATIDGPTASNSLTFSAGGVSTTINVAQSAIFSMDVNAFTLALDPSVATSATQALNIGVSSNSRLGYSLNCKVDVQPTSGAFALTPYTANMAAAAAWATGGASKFGYALSVTSNGTLGSPAAGGALSATNFSGFTTAGENCGSASGKSGNALGATSALVGCTGQSGLCDKAAHYWLMTVQAAADYTTEALSYTDNITLTVTPSY